MQEHDAGLPADPHPFELPGSARNPADPLRALPALAWPPRKAVDPLDLFAAGDRPDVFADRTPSALPLAAVLPPAPDAGPTGADRAAMIAGHVRLPGVGTAQSGPEAGSPATSCQPS